MTKNFYGAYTHFLRMLTTYSEKLNGSCDSESQHLRNDLLELVEPTLMEELDDYMLTNMTQDGCQLQVSNLNLINQNGLSENEETDDEEDPLDKVKVSLLDLKFTLGSHTDRNLNNREYVQPLKESHDGLFNINLSKLPMNYTQFPVNMCVHLQIKSPICLNIYSRDRNFSMIEQTHRDS